MMCHHRQPEMVATLFGDSAEDSGSAEVSVASRAESGTTGLPAEEPVPAGEHGGGARRTA